MRALIDTNILVDIFLQRMDYYADSFGLLIANHAGQFEGCLTASSITDIFYVVNKRSYERNAARSVQFCLRELTVLTVDRDRVKDALRLRGNDFEDNLQIACADYAGLNAIITRNPFDFRYAPMTVYSPAEFLAHLKRNGATK